MKTILFDLDGTLTNPFEGVAKGIQFTMAELGREIPETDSLRLCIGPPLHHSFGRLLEKNSNSDLVEEALTKYRLYYKDKGLFENEVYEGIPETLEALGKKFKLYVATSKPQPFAEHVIEHFGLSKHFQSIHGSLLDGGRSDKKELLAHILDEEDLNPSDTFMVGDRLYDALGAHVNEVTMLGALWGFGSRDEFKEYNVEKVFEKPSDLLAYLNAQK